MSTSATKIYKIAQPSAWQAASESADKIYKGSPLDEKDGYFHLSTAEQVPGTLGLYFKNAGKLVLIELDRRAYELYLKEDSGELKWEHPPIEGDTRLFPHGYSKTNRGGIPARVDGVVVLRAVEIVESEGESPGTYQNLDKILSSSKNDDDDESSTNSSGSDENYYDDYDQEQYEPYRDGEDDDEDHESNNNNNDRNDDISPEERQEAFRLRMEEFRKNTDEQMEKLRKGTQEKEEVKVQNKSNNDGDKFDKTTKLVIHHEFFYKDWAKAAKAFGATIVDEDKIKGRQTLLPSVVFKWETEEECAKHEDDKLVYCAALKNTVIFGGHAKKRKTKK